MMNYIQIEIGGKKRGLKFNIGTLDQLQNLYGIDPLKFKAESENYNDIRPFAKKILHAALVSCCISKKEAVDFTEADLDEWIIELSAGELTDVIEGWNNIFNRAAPSVNGEVDKGAQSFVG